MNPIAEEDALADHARLIENLRNPAAYLHPVETVEAIETHISSVLLAGQYAYKLKKPVNLGFVDFSTLAQRRHYCHEEIRLNRRTAPNLYLDVVAVGIRADGQPCFAAADAPIEYAVRMRRFDQQARLDNIARDDALSPLLIDRLAAEVAAFHAHPEVDRTTFGTPEQIRRWAFDNLTELRRLAPDEQRITALGRWTESEFARRAATFLERRTAGYVRECHGDLHLGNVVLIEEKPVLFDCIEFNPELRFIDVMSDVAFAWMDLLRYRLAHLAARFVNGYLQASGDYEGLAVLRFYAVYRALVRAKVALIQRAQSHTPPSGAHELPGDELFARYLTVAEQLTQRPQPLMLLTCGVTGSGKTTVSELLLQQMGALRVRSDVERKRRAGMAASEHTVAQIGSGLYDAETTRDTYDHLARTAGAILDAGFIAIVDATFLRRHDRQAFLQLARRLGARLVIVLCEASPQTLRERVADRAATGADASDATLQVLAYQLGAFESLFDDEAQLAFRIDTDTDPATLQARCESLVGALDAATTTRS